MGQKDQIESLSFSHSLSIHNTVPEGSNNQRSMAWTSNIPVLIFLYGNFCFLQFLEHWFYGFWHLQPKWSEWKNRHWTEQIKHTQDRERDRERQRQRQRERERARERERERERGGEGGGGGVMSCGTEPIKSISSFKWSNHSWGSGPKWSFCLWPEK